MTLNIELRPDEERALLERARLSGRGLAAYVYQILQEHIRTPGQDNGQDEAAAADEARLTWEDLIDYEAIESCAREVEGKDVPSIEEVRRSLAKIPGSMAQVVIEERKDRF